MIVAELRALLDLAPDEAPVWLENENGERMRSYGGAVVYVGKPMRPVVVLSTDGGKGE